MSESKTKIPNIEAKNCNELKSAISAYRKENESVPELSRPFLYLHGAMSQPHIIGLVRGQCIQDEVNRLDEILDSWKKATDAFRRIELAEQGLANNNFPIDIESHPKLTEISNNQLFRNTFSNSPIEFKMVDVDRLVAPQRDVSLDYVEHLGKNIPDKPTLDELIDICLSPIQNVFPVKTLQQAPNVFNFSSPSNDFRFLGGFVKNELSEDDLKYCLGGGTPVSAVILYLGYGGGSINVLQANNRLILNNGFHRVYALRKKGITRIPVVIQKIGNPELEFPPNILGLSNNYLLNHPRPVLVKDFFEKELSTVFRLKNAVRTVQVQWMSSQQNMAV